MLKNYNDIFLKTEKSLGDNLGISDKISKHVFYLLKI